MSTLRSEDGDASERELLVDDIQRIREVLHISAGRAGELTSDEEEDEGSEEEDEEDDKREKYEENSNIGVTSNNLQYQNLNCGSALKSKIPSPEAVFKGEGVGEQSSLSRNNETLSIPDSNHVPEPLSVQSPVDNNLLPSQSAGNASSDEYVLTELQPLAFIPPACGPSTSQVGYNDTSWHTELNHFQGQNDVNQQVEEEDLFSDGDEENNGDPGMYSEIQQCLSSNRDYQLAILDELERIELALAKNREQQYGLHQMRANKDERKPEPHTLIKFANPYFKDTSSVGPPDNDDTRIKRQSCQVGGYQVSKFWKQKEKNKLAEGVRMQNLENKLFPVLQRIQKLELKKVKTERKQQELEDLKAESSRIRNLPKEKLELDLEAIDWDRVSSTYVPKRSGFQCRLQWCNFGHPDVNRTAWTKEEDKMLIKLAKEPQNTWDIIAQKLQTKRTPIHCYERYQRSLNKNLLKSKWTPEDDQQLLEVVRIVGLGNWPKVASFLEGRQGDQCMYRYTQTLQLVRKGKWYDDEDELLKKAVAKYGACNWYRIAEMVPGRSGPQCRERWVNALDPKIDKGPWTKEQDQKLLENVETFGKGNWSKIARALGDRTDNQCWRRWIVLRKDDFLYYRQNTLRKKRELVANFTGRRQERPSLKPEDLDIPDVPVVRKRKGRVPLPIEESRARRRATRATYRAKKRAEKRAKLRRTIEKGYAEEDSSEATPSKKLASGGSQDEGDDDGNDGEEGSPQKSLRVRKAGNRSRVQQPHHRVLMHNKQLSKRKQVAEKREKLHTRSASGEKQVTVSGSLGPFSLLLQAFSIDIPTVLQAIQKTSPASSTSTPHPPSTVTAEVGNTPGGDKNSVGDQQSQVQTVGQKSQQTIVSGDVPNPQSSVKAVVEAREEQNQEKAKEANETNIEAKCSEINRNEAAKSTETELTIGAEVSGEANTSGIASAHAPTGTNRVETGNEPSAVKPTTAAVSSTNQATRRRAPAIPPLPPCFTTLKTLKSLLLLRPHLQQIAAMLNTAPAGSTAGSLPGQPSSTASAASSHSNKASSVTCVSGNEARDMTNESRGGDVESSGSSERIIGPNKDVGLDKHIVHKSSDSGTKLGAIVSNDYVASSELSRDTEQGNVLELGKQLQTSTDDVSEGSLLIDESRPAIEGTQTPTNDKTGSQQIPISEPLSRVTNNGGEAESSSRDSSRVQAGVSISATNSKEQNNSNRSLNQMGSQENAASIAPGIRSNNTSYRNSYEYKMLSSRFNSLLLWPALLSKIAVRGSSQIGPVFAERHPPPKGVGGDTIKNSATRKRKPAGLLEKDPFRRKRPGLAAVRMASSASLSTPGQQMCTVGQGTAIRKETPSRQPEDPSGAEDVVLAASQLVSLQETSRSLSMPGADSSPYNTRKNKRKGSPVKLSSKQTNNTCASKRSKILESSEFSLSSEDDLSSDDDSYLSDYSPPKRIAIKISALQGTRQHPSRKAAVLKATDANLPSDNQETPSTTTGQAENPSSPSSSSSLVVDLSDSAEESQPSLQGVQEDTDVTPAPGDDTADQQSGAAGNQTSKLSKNNSPMNSAKRKNSKPEKNRGARWRAMLPKVDSEDSDTQ
ncbi:hypothetical protein ACROYT_G007972 [Oculina patagonica]